MNARGTLRTIGRDTRPASAGVCGVLFIGLLCPAPARAAWDVVPAAGLSAETEENPLLNPDILRTNMSTATSLVMGAGATIANFNERGFLSVEPSVVVYRYSDSTYSSLDGNDSFFRASGEYRWQTVSAGFNSNYSRERLLSSELVDVDPDGDPDTDDPDTGDTGRLVFIDEHRERFYANPYVRFRVSERNSLQFDVTTYDVAYSGGDLAFRTGYENTRFSAGIYRNPDERNLVSAVMSVETYQADGTRNTTDTVTIEGAFARPLTELWTLNLAAGVLRSEFEYLANTQQVTARATTDYTMRVGMRRRAQRSRMNLDFVRNVYPSASGFSSIRRELRMYYDRTLTQRVTARFGVRLNETKSLGDVNIQDNREYARAEIDFEWALKPVLFLQAGFGYTAQDFTEDLIPQKADSNSIYVGMTYRGLSRRR
jgi:hypothetical protein